MLVVFIGNGQISVIKAVSLLKLLTTYHLLVCTNPLMYEHFAFAMIPLQSARYGKLSVNRLTWNVTLALNFA